jgi:hypothetical protein
MVSKILMDFLGGLNMISYKKSFLAIFMAVTLGTGFIMQAEPVQNQNTEKKDEVEGRGTQAPLDSKPAGDVKLERPQDNGHYSYYPATRTPSPAHIIFLSLGPLYHCVRNIRIGENVPYAIWEKALAGFWGVLCYASLI